MNKKITIQNNYHKRLSCEAILGRPFSMEGGEIKIVDFDTGVQLLKNVWITEVGKEINSECLPYMEKIPIVDILPEIPKEPEKPIEPEIPIIEEIEKPIEVAKTEKVEKKIIKE